LFSAPDRFYGGFAIVGGGLPVAVGLALAEKMQNTGRIVACFFGDGATEEGEHHESLNLAALWKLPLLFLCENNQYAMGTALSRHAAQTDLAEIPRAHTIETETVDGMDVVAVEEATRRAAAAIRETGTPRYLVFSTYRFRAHSMYDPDRYRDKTEVAKWRERDPIALFESRLRAEKLLDDEALAGLDREANAATERAVRAAEEAPLESISDLERDVCTRVVP
jgi:pyruvate dehydrogenase E1 component alpha subunit